MIRRPAALLALYLLATLAPLAAAAQEATIRDVFKRVAGSVVVIRTEEKTLTQWSGGEMVSVGGLGSGVLISEDGKILTAAHVIQAAAQIIVEFPSGEIVRARPVASVPSADVALIQLERPPRSQMVVAKMGNSDGVEVGEEIFIVGAPLGISHSLTVGHISARRDLDRTMSGMFEAEFFQTDAAINQGNSGGPMFNMNGEVIGVVSHMISPTGGYAGLGFATTSNAAKTVLVDRKAFWWGFDGLDLEGDLALALNVPGRGILVQRVAENSPASQLGLQGGKIAAVIKDQPVILGGDIIVAVAGVELSQTDAFKKVQSRLDMMSEGQTLVVEVLRRGERTQLQGQMPKGSK
jgi:S1-C subfamily serine protease